MIPCRVARGSRHDDPDFRQLLVEANNQRVKRVDQVFAEEIVKADPEEAHRVLTQERKKRSAVSVETIELKEARTRCKISKAKEPFLQAVLAIIEERRDYWPLTDRQIHYPLLNDPPLIHASKPESTYRNIERCYKALCELLTRARLERRIPPRAIHDPTRPVETWNFPRDVGSFIRQEMDGFLKCYYRDLQQSQPNHIEIIGEKNTIHTIVRRVAAKYTVPYTIGRGYCSLPPREAMAARFKRSGKDKLILLALSDFDPEGEDIAESYARSMRDDFGIKDIVPIKVALNAKQVADLGLPPQMKAKEGSSRCKGFVDKHGDDVFEIEAAAPDWTEATLEEAIDSVLDVDAFNAEVKKEQEEAAKLLEIRQALMAKIDYLQTE
jgi:hypothetical protein